MADYKIQLGVQLDSKSQENINNQLRKIEAKIETATLSKKAISSIQDQLKSANLGITIDTTSIKKAQNEVNKLVDSVRKASGLSLGNQLKNNSSSKSDANFLADQQRILAQNEKYWKQNTAAAKEYEQQWTQAFSNVENAQSKAQLTTATKQINALKAEIDNAGSKMNQTNFLADQQKELANIKTYINANTKAANQYGEALKQAQTNVRGATNTQELTTARKQFQALKAEISAAGMSGLSFGDKLKSEISNLTSFFSATSIILSSVSHLKNGFNELVALDDAMVELKKVTDETNESYKNFYYQANDIAKQLGATTQEVITQTANWAQLGYAMQDAINLAKDSSILSTISPEMDIDTATETLISTMKAYKIEANDVMDGINSKINIVGNNFASNNNDISEMLKRSSAAMAAANNTLEQNIALGVAGNEIVQDSASVGTALKTISMRIRANVFIALAL